ncbi:hypothetical protein FRC11_007604 [Ceratobasidium sp. 423]|nr:hypothetical protein FRC11_007604 [Ceratobasidium sp. 423]
MGMPVAMSHSVSLSSATPTSAILPTLMTLTGPTPRTSMGQVSTHGSTPAQTSPALPPAPRPSHALAYAPTSTHKFMLYFGTYMPYVAHATSNAPQLTPRLSSALAPASAALPTPDLVHALAMAYAPLPAPAPTPGPNYALAQVTPATPAVSSADGPTHASAPVASYAPPPVAASVSDMPTINKSLFHELYKNDFCSGVLGSTIWHSPYSRSLWSATRPLVSPGFSYFVLQRLREYGERHIVLPSTPKQKSFFQAAKLSLGPPTADHGSNKCKECPQNETPSSHQRHIDAGAITISDSESDSSDLDAEIAQAYGFELKNTGFQDTTVPTPGNSKTTKSLCERKRAHYGTKWTGGPGGALKFNAKPEGFVEGVDRWSYSEDPPKSALTTKQLEGDIHFHPVKQYLPEEEPFNSWVCISGPEGLLQWIEFLAGQPHPHFKGFVFKPAELPRKSPRWVRESSYKSTHGHLGKE